MTTIKATRKKASEGESPKASPPEFLARKERLAVGKALRDKVSRERHAAWKPSAKRREPNRLVQAKQLWMALQGLYTTLYVVLAILLAYLWFALVLDLFPWTRPLGQRLIEMFVNPLRAMALGFLGFIPDLVFLGILFVVILALVVAYPYIPGSGSDAFKGLSIFLGVIFSLGSSSIIANLIAGYTMIYRRAFRIGDRIQVGDIGGVVTETRLLVTHIRTIKNEEIIVPNSMILNSHVINYSTLAKS